MRPQKYTKKPVTIEAVQLSQANAIEAAAPFIRAQIAERSGK